MKISELVYEVRTLARKEEDPVKKDLLFQSAKALEILGNIAKISDLIVAEYKTAEKPATIDETGEEGYSINEMGLQMLDEHIEALLFYKFIIKDDRWPYGLENVHKFIPQYLKSHIVKDSNIE